jgi:hypothetical protein
MLEASDLTLASVGKEEEAVAASEASQTDASDEQSEDAGCS